MTCALTVYRFTVGSNILKSMCNEILKYVYTFSLKLTLQSHFFKECPTY